MRRALSCIGCFLLACGGTAVIDAEDEGDGGAGTFNECEGKACGTACRIANNPGPPTGVCTDDQQCAYDTTCEGPCSGKLCGDPCVVCNPVECLEGVCGSLGECAPEKPFCG